MELWYKFNKNKTLTFLRYSSVKFLNSFFHQLNPSKYSLLLFFLSVSRAHFGHPFRKPVMQGRWKQEPQDSHL